MLGLSWFEELNLSFVCVGVFTYPPVVWSKSNRYDVVIQLSHSHNKVVIKIKFTLSVSCITNCYKHLSHGEIVHVIITAHHRIFWKVTLWKGINWFDMKVVQGLFKIEIRPQKIENGLSDQIKSLNFETYYFFDFSYLFFYETKINGSKFETLSENTLELTPRDLSEWSQSNRYHGSMLGLGLGLLKYFWAGFMGLGMGGFLHPRGEGGRILPSIWMQHGK